MAPQPTATAAGPSGPPHGTALQRPDVSHFGPMEQPGEIATMITEFLGDPTA